VWEKDSKEMLPTIQKHLHRRGLTLRNSEEIKKY